MPASNTPVPAQAALIPTPDTWLADATARFAPNRFGLIDDEDFRAVFAGIAQVFASWRHLSVKTVKGATYPVPYTDTLGLVPENYRILGMQAVALNGVDAATGAAGVTAPQVFFTLLRDSAGPVDALLDAEPATVLTVKARWVQTSGTDEDKLAQFEFLEPEDRHYAAGDVVKYAFPGGEIRLLEWRADSVGFQHPVPTGLDSDPIYAPFAPLAAPAAYDDTALRAQVQQVEDGLTAAGEDIASTQNGVAQLGYRVDDLEAFTRNNALLRVTSAVYYTSEIDGVLRGAASLVEALRDITQRTMPFGTVRSSQNVFVNDFKDFRSIAGLAPGAAFGFLLGTANEPVGVNIENGEVLRVKGSAGIQYDGGGILAVTDTFGLRNGSARKVDFSEVGNATIRFPCTNFVIKDVIVAAPDASFTLVLYGTSEIEQAALDTLPAGITIEDQRPGRVRTVNGVPPDTAGNVQVAGTGTGANDPRKDLVTQPGYRTNTLVFEQRHTFSNPVLGPNAKSVAGQLVKASGGVLVAVSAPRTGTPQAVLNALTADFAALSAADCALVYARFVTTALTESDEAHFLLTATPV